VASKIAVLELQPFEGPSSIEELSPAKESLFLHQGAVGPGIIRWDWSWLVAKPGVQSLHKNCEEDGIRVQRLAAFVNVRE
jgi:hypothetical protein